MPVVKVVERLGLVLPLALEWLITDSCNLQCKYCSDGKPVFKEIDYTRVLQKVIELSPRHIWIGGGEPTLVKQLPLILNRLKKELGAHIGLSTNLTLPGILRETLEYIDDLIISIDTADAGISKKYRHVDPEALIGNIKKLSAQAKRNKDKVNITVNSVVYKESIFGNDGIEKLNDRLFEIDNNMWHIFCPVFPAAREDSIINDGESVKAFFGIVDRLRSKKRNIMISFPETAKEKTFVSGKYRCYRKFFRIKLSEDGEFFSPCPKIELSDPVCNTPCNCAAFLDDIILMKDRAKLDGSPLKGKLDHGEIGILKEFHGRYPGLHIQDDVYNCLLRK